MFILNVIVSIIRDSIVMLVLAAIIAIFAVIIGGQWGALTALIIWIVWRYNKISSKEAE